MNLSRTGVQVAVTRGVSSLVLFVGLAVYARELSPAVMGSFFIFRVAVDLFGLLTDFGLSGATEKRISENHHPAGELLATALLLKTMFLLVAIAAAFAFRNALRNYVGFEVVIPLIAALVLKEFGWLFIHAMRGNLQIEETVGFELVRHLLWTGVGVALVFAGFQLRGVLYGYLAGLGVLLGLGVVRTPIHFGRPSIAHARSLINFSKHNFVAEMGGYVYGWLDVAMIGFFLSQTEVGLYEYAWRATVPILIIGNAITTTLFPVISNWNSRGKSKAIEETISTSIGAALYIAIPTIFGGVIVGKELLRYLFAEPYAAAWVVLVVLTFEKALQMLRNVFGPVLHGIDRPDLTARATAITLVVNFALNLLLIPRFGIVGAAVATTMSVLLSTAIHGIYLASVVTVDPPIRLVGWFTASGAAMAACLLALRSIVAIDSLVSVIAAVVLGAVVYVALTAAIPITRRQIVRPGFEAIRT
jgi:O-antigen/teichoic acid export membrane protein